MQLHASNLRVWNATNNVKKSRIREPNRRYLATFAAGTDNRLGVNIFSKVTKNIPKLIDFDGVICMFLCARQLFVYFFFRIPIEAADALPIHR